MVLAATVERPLLAILGNYGDRGRMLRNSNFR